MNYRFIRGLSQLLGRRAVIETDASVDPSLAREAVFGACGGMALSPAEKKEAFHKAAKKLSISEDELEKALWADLEENQIVKSFFSLSPVDLLGQYNISLTQTLLFRAVDLDIWIKGGFQKMLWKVLRSGLMYHLEDPGEPISKTRIDEKEDSGNEEKKAKRREPEGLNGVHIHIDGPASLFRMSERYGNSFAKLFPALLQSKGWRLKASILHKTYQGKRILEFSLDDSEEAFNPSFETFHSSEALPSGFKLEEAKEKYKAGMEREIQKESETGSEEGGTENQEIVQEEAKYDSAIEKTFGSLNLGGWKVVREPTILRAGRYAFVPDFALQREGMKVYLEIVGFWTSEYLEKKVEKLKDVREPLILLIDRKLKCSEKDFPAQEVIFFDKKLPASEIMKVLRKYEGEKRIEDRLSLQEIEFSLSGELINLEDIAAEKGVLLDSLKEVIKNRLEYGELKEVGNSERAEEYRNYVLLENYLIHRQLLERINLELEKLRAVETYADAVKVFESFRLDRSLYYSVLEELGYKVIWAGLSEDSARIKKMGNQRR
jgi:predicted nuclease of restriction endonuclease-like RecB superfamily